MGMQRLQISLKVSFHPHFERYFCAYVIDGCALKNSLPYGTVRIQCKMTAQQFFQSQLGKGNKCWVCQ